MNFEQVKNEVSVATQLNAQAVKVKGNYTQAEIKRVKDFLRKENIYKQFVAMLSFLIPNKKNIKLNLNVGGGSYTDGKSVTVGLPEIFMKRSHEEMFSALQALLGHETQHVNSSDFEGFVKFQHDIADHFYKKFGISKKEGQKIGKYIFNAIEDGRIEKILCNRLPGYKKHIQFLNATFWDEQPIGKNSELQDFLYTITIYSVSGLYPKGFKDAYNGSELHDNIRLIKKDIQAGIDAVTCQECLLVCFQAVLKVDNYIAELIKNSSEEDQQFMQNIPDENEWTTSEETQQNTGDDSPHLVPKKKKDSKTEEQEENEDTSKDESIDDTSSDVQETEGAGEEESGKGESESKEDEKSEEESEDGEGTGTGSELDEDESEEDESKSGGKSDKDSDDEETTDETESTGNNDGKVEGENENTDESANGEENTDGDELDSKEKVNDNKKSDDIPDGTDELPPGVDEEEDDDDLDVDEDLIRDKMQEITDDVIEDAEKKIQQSEETPSKKSKDKSTDINQDDIDEIEALYKKQGVRKFKEIKGFENRYNLPGEIKLEGKKFRREIEKIFRNKETYNQRAQTKGILDTSNLWKTGVKDYNVFVKRGTPVTTDYVAYILQDGSGSMNEDGKEFQSAKAMSVLEEGLKGIVPFKVTTFSVGDIGIHSYGVIHYTAKDWNDTSLTQNYSYNFHRQRRASGGNKDGYSIRMATKELLKRPEKDRILIILSDGLPSDYNKGYAEGMVDVKEAVKEARKKGIHVVSLIFGDEEFRTENMEKYKYMYDRNIISCEPSEITPKLVKSLKTIISR